MRRGIIAAALLLGVTASVIAWLHFSTPRHQGRTVNDWLRTLSTTTNEAERVRAVLALRELGTNAMPELLGRVEARDSAFRSNVTHALAKQKMLPVPRSRVPQGVREAYDGFDALGTNASAAISELVRMLDDPAVAQRASSLLIRMGDEVIPALIIATTNANVNVRRSTLIDLGHRRANSTNAVDALLKGFTSDPDPTTRVMAGYALSRIPNLPDSVLAPLIKALDDPNRDIAQIAAQALGNSFGPRAKAAVPMLIRLWEKNGVSSGANVALTKIDPEAAEKVGATVAFKPNPYE